MDELQKKINMWRIALEERNANMSIMQVFDNMMIFMGEQQRENEKLTRAFHKTYVREQKFERLMEILTELLRKD